MDDRQYWFPVRPAGRGWGWGIPQVWQGWVVYLVFLVLLIGGAIVLAPLGATALIAYECALCAGLLAIAFWKGEPQSRRHHPLQ